MLLFVLFSMNVHADLILKHPVNLSECVGASSISFLVSADTRGYTGISYQWQYKAYRSLTWQNISAEVGGGTEDSPKLTILFDKTYPLTTQMNKTQFRCVVTGTLNFSKLTVTESSNAAYLYVNTGPNVYSDPSPASKFPGESVTFSVSASSSLPLDYQWQKDAANISGAGSSAYTIASVSAADEGVYRCRVSNSCGFVYSGSAELSVKTLEFGNGWIEQVSPTSQDIRMVDAYNQAVAWAVTGDNDRLVKTEDGGESWSSFQAGYSSSYWQCIEMITENLVLTGGRVIGKTEDAGGSWDFYDVRTELSLDEYIYIYDLKVGEGGIGYAVGSGGLIIKTEDFGNSWIKQNWQNDPAPITDVDLRGVHFINSDMGWAVGNNGVILKTTNGGDSWTKINTPYTQTLKGIWFIDESIGFASGAGSYRHILKTTDGGASWTSISDNIPAGFYPQGIIFTDEGNGYAIGQRYDYDLNLYKGSVLKTVDQGENWYMQRIDNANQLYSISMLNKNEGWVVGDAGEIQRTSTGGCHNPAVNLYADQSFCASGSYMLVADTFENNINCSYLWNTGQTQGHINVNETGTYSVTVTNLCGNSASDEINVNVFPLPEADAGENVSVCQGDSVQLNASGGILYSWNNEIYLNDAAIQNPFCGPPVGTTNFNVTVRDENGCENTDNVFVTVGTPYADEEICMVTIDLETGKNMVVWEKTPDVGIESYNVFRLGTGGVYNLLGNVPSDELSVFVDMDSEPEKTQYLYKIATVDTCGNESPKSHYHKTLFLQYTSSDGGVNLLWQDYEVEDESIEFSDFYIFRGSDSTKLAVIDTVSGTNVYTDVDVQAQTQKMFYRVAGVKPDPCDPAGLLDKKAGNGPFVHSLSNLEDNRLQTNVNNSLETELNLALFPNPASDQTTLQYNLPYRAEVKIEIFNIMGKKMMEIPCREMLPGYRRETIDIKEFSRGDGLYYIRVWVNNQYITRKLIINR